jgi:hypothetical protein
VHRDVLLVERGHELLPQTVNSKHRQPERDQRHRDDRPSRADGQRQHRRVSRFRPSHGEVLVLAYLAADDDRDERGDEREREDERDR